MEELRLRFDVTDEEDTEVYPVHSDSKFGNKDRPIYVISVRKQVILKHHVIKESVAVVVENDMMGKAAPPGGFLRIRISLRSRTTMTKDEYMTAKPTDRSS